MRMHTIKGTEIFCIFPLKINIPYKYKYIYILTYITKSLTRNIKYQRKITVSLQ